MDDYEEVGYCDCYNKEEVKEKEKGKSHIRSSAGRRPSVFRKPVCSAEFVFLRILSISTFLDSYIYTTVILKMCKSILISL